MSSPKESVWTPENDELIERAVLAGLDFIGRVGPVPPLAIAQHTARVNTEFDRQISNDIGTSTAAKVAVARMVLRKRARLRRAHVIELKVSARLSGTEDYGKQLVLKTLDNHGGSLTRNNLVRLLKTEGYGEQTTADAVQALRKQHLIKLPFFKRGVIDLLPLRSAIGDGKVPDYVPEDLA